MADQQLPDVNEVVDSFIECCCFDPISGDECILEKEDPSNVSIVENELAKIKSCGPEFCKLFLKELLCTIVPGEGWYLEDVMFICRLLDIKDINYDLIELPEFHESEEDYGEEW